MDKDDQVQRPTPAAPGTGAAGGSSRLTKPRFSCRRWYLLTGTDKDDAPAPALSARSQKPNSPGSPFLPEASPRPPITKQWGELTGVYAPRQPRSNQRQREAERRRLRDRIYLPSVQHTLQRFRRPQTQAPFQGPAALSLLRVPPIGTDLLSDRLHSLRSSLEADPPMAPTPMLWCPQPPRQDQRPIAPRPRPGGGRAVHRVRETPRPETITDSFEELLEDAESDAATSMSSLETHVCAALSNTDTMSSLSSLETHVCAALEAREYAVDAVHGSSRDNLPQSKSEESHEQDLLTALSGSNSSEDGDMSGYLTGMESDGSLMNRSEDFSISPSDTEASLHSSEPQSDRDAEYTTGVSDSASAVSSQTSVESLNSESAWSVDSISPQSAVAANDPEDSSKEQDRVVAEVVQSMIDSTQASPAQELAKGPSIGCSEEWIPPSSDQPESRVNDSAAPADAPALVPLTPMSLPAIDPEQAPNKSNAESSGDQDGVIDQLLRSMIDSITVMGDDAQEEAPTDHNQHPFEEKAEPELVRTDDEPTVAMPEPLHGEEPAGDADDTKAEIVSQAHAEISTTDDRTSPSPEPNLVGDHDPATEISTPIPLLPVCSETGLMGAPAVVHTNSSDAMAVPEVDMFESHCSTEAAVHDVESKDTTGESTAPPELVKLVADADEDEDYEQLESEPETIDQDPRATKGGLAITESDEPTVPASVEESEPDETYEDDAEEEYAIDPDSALILNDYEADFDFDADDEDEDAQEYAFDGDEE